MTFLSELTDAIRSGLCSYIQFYNNWADFIFDDPILSTDLTRQARNSLQRFLCNREPPPTPPPPFTGGQCPARYFISLSGTFDGDTAPGVQGTPFGPVATNVWGPISGFEVVNSGSSSTLICNCQGGGTFPSGPSQISLFSVGYDGTNSLGIQTFSVDSISRLDSLPDDCGDPPPIVPPPDPPVVDTDITYVDADNNSVTIPVTLVYAPVTVDFNGNLSIPVRVNVDAELSPSFSANIDISTGDININFGDQNYSPTITNPPSSYDTSDDIPDVPPDVPDDYPIPDPLEPGDDTIRILKGCIVTVTSIPPGITEVFQEDNPNIFVPRLGNVQFAIRIGTSLSWTEEIFVKNRRQFIPCPWEGGAIDVKGTPVPNVTWVITPVYAKTADTVEYTTL